MHQNTINNLKNLKGLSDAEVKSNREKFGKNILTEGNESLFLKIAFDLIREPMVIILVLVSVIYFVTQQFTEGVIMLIAILIVSGISFYQEFRSSKAILELRKLNQPFSNVVRNGTNISIQSEELVVNDLLMIEEGQIVPADAELLYSYDLTVDESILTGESVPVEKNSTDKKIYNGTLVTSGWGYFTVTAVGMNTKTGKLGKSIEEIVKEKSPLQLQINKFVKLMAMGGLIAFIFVWVYNFILSGDFLESLMHGLTLAMAVLPEELPVAFSTFMALGAYHLIKNNIITKQPAVVESLGSATVICLDKTGTITENKMQVTRIFDVKTKSMCHLENGESVPDNFNEIIEYAMRASEINPFDPMEKAIHDTYNSSINKPEVFEIIHEYQLKQHAMTHVFSEGENYVAACKGAPETIFEFADLGEDLKNSSLRIIEEMASEGLRVIAVAKSARTDKNFPVDQSEFEWEYLGLLGLEDPPKKNIKKVINEFYKCGIEVKMLTGDYPVTAISIADQAGIINNGKVQTGREVINMQFDKLAEAVKTVNIFARVFPEAKLKIIEALKHNGDVVAMTGDGVNDGPALKASHIGIAMGKKGSETAKKSASLIILNDDLSNMVTAVTFGRKIYANLKKAFSYIISIHIPLISVVTLPLLFNLKYLNIFSPVHVIFLELVMGPTCSIAFENEPVEKNLMNEKPRKMSSELFKTGELIISILQGIVIILGLMFIMNYASENLFSEDKARILVFTTLVFSNIFLTMTGRSRKLSLFETLFLKNYLLYFIIIITLSILFLSLNFTPLMEIFGFTQITSGELTICILTSFLSVIWIELYKLVNFKIKKSKDI